jgi:diguanylate cyclase (GGDEF)-like protein/PAS domain S-box-containing protein
MAGEGVAAPDRVYDEPLARLHRFEAMFHDHEAVMLLVDPVTGLIVDANPSAAAFYGYPLAQLRSMPITEINMNSASEVAKRLGQAHAGIRGHFVCPHRLANGEVRRVDVHSSPIHDGRDLLFSIVVDIEDRVRAEEALARTSGYSRSLIEASLDPLVMISPDGVITDVNVAAETVTGIGRHALIGSDFAAYFTDPELASAGYREAFRLGSITDYPLAIRRTDGTVTDVLYNASVYRDEGGRVAGVFAAVRDVTERRRAQEELAVSEYRYRILSENADGAVLLVSTAGGVIWASPSIERLLGYTPAEIMALDGAALVHPDDLDAARGAVPRSDAPTSGAHVRFRRKDGQYRWMEASSRTVTDSAGRVTGRIDTLRDIHEEVLALQELTAAEEESRLAFDRSSVATCLVSNDGRIIRANPAICELLEYSEAELVTLSFLDVTHPDDTAVGADLVLELLAGERESIRLTKRYLTGQGHTVWGDVTVSAVREADGNVRHRIAQILDVTDRVTSELALAASEERLRAVLDSTRDTTIRVGRDGRIEYVNRRAIEISGIESDKWIGRTFAELGFPAELVQEWNDQRHKVFASGEPATFEFEIDNREGHRWYETNVAPEFDREGTVAHTIETSRDITRRKAAEDALRASRAQLEQAQRIAHVGYWTLDLTTDQIALSDELYTMLGLDPRLPSPDLTDLGGLFTPESWLDLSSATAASRESGAPYELELEIVRPDGNRRWMLARAEAVIEAGGRIVGMQGVSLDISARKFASDELQILATHDPLTGLANRASLLGELTRALSSGRRSGRLTAVLMMDLDRFKHINDTLGHREGDALLVAAARRIETAVRAGDLVARLGGDEFVVVMRDLDDPDEALRAAGRLVAEFRRPFTTDIAELYATASIGIAFATEFGDAGDLVREADTAMYFAKEQGRDRLSVFTEDLRTAVSSRLSIETDLRQALHHGQLAVWFQPEVDLATGAVVAVEALLRWHRHDGEIWTADRFVDVAEDTGLILDIGEWVLRTACSQAAAWSRARPERTLTTRVNISALQLVETGLLPALDDALAVSGLDPELLCVEITETALLHETSTARDNLEGIHRRGIRIALDDFGTGFASLSYLRKYPVDVIKIDRSFISTTTEAHHDHRLVAGIIALASILGITVTAEGVEQPGQAAHLREMGCPSAQGWLYSEALPADQLTPLLDHVYPH